MLYEGGTMQNAALLQHSTWLHDARAVCCVAWWQTHTCTQTTHNQGDVVSLGCICFSGAGNMCCQTQYRECRCLETTSVGSAWVWNAGVSRLH